MQVAIHCAHPMAAPFLPDGDFCFSFLQTYKTSRISTEAPQKLRNYSVFKKNEQKKPFFY
jgi:hypothetical protein